MGKQNISLLVLAAGMGSRYGGLKQLDGLGPADETILEYSLYDAIKSGFTKVVFVVRDFFLDEFRERMDRRFADKIALDYVCQNVNPPFPNIDGVIKRDKPWGTSHAVLVAKDAIKEPFAVINADDYYGQDSFQIMADFLTEAVSDSLYCMIGYILQNTLSDKGHVNRGVCKVDAAGHLVSVEEILKIRREKDRVVFGDPVMGTLSESDVVSMNFWGFPASIFKHLEDGFHQFVSENRSNPKAEYFIPLIIDDLINSGKIDLRVLTCNDQWYGVTYKEDAARVRDAFRQFVKEGKYPNPLLSGIHS